MMSLDFFFQHLPVGIRSVDDIPADYEPGPIGARAAVVDSIRTVFPTVDFSDPEWGRIEGDGFSIEVNLRGEDPVRGFALHVRGNSPPDGAIAALADKLGCRALDPQSPTGILDSPQAQ